MRLMDGSAPQYTLRHLSIWSLNLYPGRNFSIAANRQAALSRASPSLHGAYVIRATCAYGHAMCDGQADVRMQRDAAVVPM